MARRGIPGLRSARRRPMPLMTTCYILAECGNAVARTTMRLEVDVLRARLEAAGRLVFPIDEDWRSAWDGYRRGRPARPDS